MKTAIQLGKNTFLDPMKLIEGRMLVVGNSGSGKSYLMRKLCEGIVDVIPTIVLDREGEFATLREEHDVVLIGEGGEADTAVATAAKLARALVELGVSAVVNLYDLTKPDKRKFVRLFLESLLNLPRSLWRPMIVIIDEAHEFCPEAGRDAESREAVIRLMDQGRKRGIGGILATQRFAKLSKDAAGEANNVCIGRIVQDVDLRRASDTLGFAGKSEWATLRELDPGQWFAFGPGFSHRGIEKFTGLEAKTTHPKPGERHKLTPPAPSKAILKVAPDLKALKAAVVAEQDELTRLRAENKELRSTRAPKVVAPAPFDPAPHVLAGREDAVRMIAPVMGDLRAVHQQAMSALAEFDRLKEILAPPIRNRKKANGRDQAPKTNEAAPPRVTPPLRSQAEQRAPRPARAGNGAADPAVGRGQLRALMVALAQNPEGLDRVQLAVLAGASPTSGGYAGNLATMRAQGWMETSNGSYSLTDAGLQALGSYEPLPTGQALVQYWLTRQGDGLKRRVLQSVIDAGSDGISRDDLAQVAECSPTSGGYAGILAEFRKAKLIEGKGNNRIRAAAPLLEAAGA